MIGSVGIDKGIAVMIREMTVQLIKLCTTELVSAELVSAEEFLPNAPSLDRKAEPTSV